ncbi:MAG: STAS domain-containing protein [Myxococcota bacterium]
MPRPYLASVEANTAKPASHLTLPEDFTLPGLVDTYESIRKAYVPGVPFILDGSNVERCDAAAVQILLALAKTAAEDESPSQILNPSPALTEGFNTLMLSHVLETLSVNDSNDGPKEAL